MNEPQVWLLTATLSAAVLSIPTMFLRTMRSDFGAVRSEIKAVRTEIGAVRTEIGAVRTEVTSLRSETEAGVEAVRSEVRRVEGVLTAQFTHLDRDVQAITRKVFGDDAV